MLESSASHDDELVTAPTVAALIEARAAPGTRHILDRSQRLDRLVKEPFCKLVGSFGPVVLASFHKIGLCERTEPKFPHAPWPSVRLRSSLITSGVSGRLSH